MLRIILVPVFLFAGCPEPNAAPAPQIVLPAPARAVLELYLHEDGSTRCVDGTDKPWVAYKCCPDGFSPAGFSVRAATEYTSESQVDRTLYRHLVCLQDVN